MFYIAIVGRPNVGKSTLYNKIVGGRPAIVDHIPGVTRDRNIAFTKKRGRKFGLIDSGGFEPDSREALMEQVKEQAMMAIEEADIIFFVVDGRKGMTTLDERIAGDLRKTSKPVYLVVNKIDDPGKESLAHDFASLGFGSVHAVSAEHSLGIEDLLDEATGLFPEDEETRPEDVEPDHAVRIAVVGKPNVGKSSLVNKLLGYDRMMVSDIAGTTRDAVDSDISHDGKRYTLIDTAGIRRKAKVTAKLEKYSVIMAVKAIERSDVALLMIDAVEGVTTQEAKIGGLIDESGKGCVIAVNKWDIMEKDDKTTLRYTEAIRNQLAFLPGAPVVFISSLTGQRLDRVWSAVDEVFDQYSRRIGSGALNSLMASIKAAQSPPMRKNRRVKIYYATQVSVMPPTFVFMTNMPEGVHFSYKRYIANQLRRNAGFDKTPIRMIFRKPAGRRTNTGRGGVGR